MHMDQPLKRCDAVIAMGSHDLRIAAYAARLVLEKWAPLLICSGGSGRLTDSIWQESEASLFADAAIAAGLPSDKILLEDKSTNTGENLIFSKRLCEKQKIACGEVLLVHKPYMERRVWAAAGKLWSEAQVTVTSPPIPFLEYPTNEIPLEQVIQIMTGDFQRVLIYPEKGYALAQPVPDNAMSAFDFLIRQGFTQHLVPQ